MDQTAPAQGGGGRRFDAALAAPFAVLAVLAAFAAHRNVARINPDAIAYARIAGYWASGRTDLAVNGYWGPLLSWLMAPLASAFADPLAAGRAVMAASALVFHAGIVRLARSLGLSRDAVIAAAWASVGPIVVWSVELITPDLLLAGLLASGTSLVVGAHWPESRRTQAVAGILFGVAYLAKAAALPVAVLLVATAAVLAGATRAAPWPRLARAAAATGAAALVVALPWIVVLSARYHAFTFSTTGPIAHAVVGPADADRYYPTFRTFHVPAAGRLTSWEDPAELAYAKWSPLASAGLLRHQARVVVNNAAAIANYLRDFDVLGIGLAALVLAFAAHRPWRDNLRGERWRWALPLVACNVAVFLPVFAYSERYYYAAYPLLLCAALGLCGSLVTSRCALALVAASFAATAFPAAIPGWPYSVPERPGVVGAVRGLPDGRAAAARELATRLAAAGVAGPVAGDGHESLYVAWYLGSAWHGSEDAPTADRAAASGAAVFVTRRGSPTAKLLAADARFEDLAPRIGAPEPSLLTAFRVRR